MDYTTIIEGFVFLLVTLLMYKITQDSNNLYLFGGEAVED